MERFNRLKELINEYNQPATLSPVIVPEDGLSFFYSLKANIHLNRDLLGDTSYLQHILANDGQNLRTEWIDEYKEILTRCNRSDELVNKWDQVWEEFKKIGFKSSDELNKLFLMFSAYKTRRHLVIIDDSSDNTSNSSDFIILVSGDIICENNVVNSSPILLCRVKSKDHRQHFQPLISTDSQFWRQFCEENIRYNKTGSNLIIIKKRNIDSMSNDKSQELPNSFYNESQIRVSEETLNHHLIEVNDGYNVKEIKKEQSIDLTKELTDITDIESHSLNDAGTMKAPIEDPLQDFQSVQDVDKTPKVDLEPVHEIWVKDKFILEPSEVKTEPLEYPQPYLLPSSDKIQKNEVKSDLLDYNDEQDCGLPPIVITCQGCNNKFHRLLIHLQAKEKCREKYPGLFIQPKTEICKGCSQEVGYLLTHLQQVDQCRMHYSQEEILCFQTEINQLIPVKQKIMNNLLCQGCNKRFKEFLEHLEHLKQSGECYLFYTEQEISSLQLKVKHAEKQKKSNGPKTEFSKTCKVCNESFNRLISHIRYNKICKSQYTEEELEIMKVKHITESQRNYKLKVCGSEDGKAKKRFRSMEYKMRKMQEDPEGFKKKENERTRRSRLKQKQEDPEGFREKANERRRRSRLKQKQKDPEGLREKENERRRRSRLKQKQEDPEGFREKENERNRRRRLKQMQEDPEGFREKENEIERRSREKNLSTARENAKLRQLEYRKRKMEEDPEGFREKENESKRRQRMRKIQEEDPEGFREEENERVRRHREKNLSTAREKERLKQMEYRKKMMQEDPERFRDESKVMNEESKHKEVDYREGDFMGHQMEISDSNSEGDEDKSSYEHISEEYEDASNERQMEVDPKESDHTKLVAEVNEDDVIKDVKDVESSEGDLTILVAGENNDANIKETNEVVYSLGDLTKLVAEAKDDASIEEEKKVDTCQGDLTKLVPEEKY